VQSLTKKAQRYFNAYIRERDKNKLCVSCDKPLGSKYDAGHYFSTSHKNVTFNENNVHGQCVACNQHKHGNLLNYQIGIEKRIGGEKLIKLHEEAHKVRKYTREELKQIIEKYKQKKKDLNK
jgi:predicted transcriptional regulator with HTH domain